ncbi:hypothetical protein ACFPRL_30270 [Pseudoclavibacter helvolus]
MRRPSASNSARAICSRSGRFARSAASRWLRSSMIPQRSRGLRPCWEQSSIGPSLTLHPPSHGRSGCFARSSALTSASCAVSHRSNCNPAKTTSAGVGIFATVPSS